MAENSTIEWTHHTFNPWIGCQKVGPGCDHCYAEAMMDTRLGRVEWGPHAARSRTSPSYWQKPLAWDKAAKAAGERHRVFCASLADVFDNHESIQHGWRASLWRLIAETPHLDWMLLTKRPGNIAKMLPDQYGLPAWGTGWPNVWLGCTIVNQEEADRDILKLLSVPAAVRFLSMEPLLGPVDLTSIERPAGAGVHVYSALECDVDPEDDEWGGATIDLVIVGGESGPGARPMNPQNVRDIRNQCVDAGTSFFFKQWGEWVSVSEVEGPGEHFRFPDGRTVRRTGKKLAGRTLDGRTWDEMPGQKDGA